MIDAAKVGDTVYLRYVIYDLVHNDRHGVVTGASSMGCTVSCGSKVDPLENTSEGSHLYYFHFQLDTTKGDN